MDLPNLCSLLSAQSLTFERFAIQAGSDDTGVSTDMISINSTLKFNFRNTATFFGVHATSSPVDLSYFDLTVGSGTVSHAKKKKIIFVY